MTSRTCASCGAAAPAAASACSYCGSVIAENVRIAGDGEASSAEKALELLASNIGSLRDFPRPENGFITILRIYVALITMGISLLFWRRPKHRFRVDEFRKLRGIIETNMALLKARHRNNGDIVAQVDALEGEFAKIESSFTRQITTRRVILGATAIVAAWLVITGETRKRGIVDEASVYVPGGETYVAHGMKANRPYMALVTRTAGEAQRIYIVDRTTGEARRVLNTAGGVLEEQYVTGIRAISDGRFEYSKREGGRWSYHAIIWDDARKKYVKAYSR